jgi:hypothetical protein
MININIMTPAGLETINSAYGEHENTLMLLAVNNWEDALAYLVSKTPFDNMMTWILQRLMTDSAAPDEREKACGQEMINWLKNHDDACRWRIFNQAGQLGFDCPMGGLGLALFWSKGSMTPAEFEAVYPEKHLAPLMLHCVLMQISVRLAGEQAPIIGAQTLVAQWYTSQGGN